MAVKSKQEILDEIGVLVGAETSDEVLAVIEDVTDTIDEYERKIGDDTDWEAKYNELDTQWREKYKARFFDSDAEDVAEEAEAEADAEEADETLTYEDLFEDED